MFHGIVLDKEFKDPSIIGGFKVFNKRKSRDEDWILYGIEVEDKELAETLSFIQKNLKDREPFYCHFYNGEKLIVVFKEKIFNVTLDRSTWKPFIDYGLSLKIPKGQLEVSPVSFDAESDYFTG